MFNNINTLIVEADDYRASEYEKNIRSHPGATTERLRTREEAEKRLGAEDMPRIDRVCLFGNMMSRQEAIYFLEGKHRPPKRKLHKPIRAA